MPPHMRELTSHDESTEVGFLLLLLMDLPIRGSVSLSPFYASTPSGIEGVAWGR